MLIFCYYAMPAMFIIFLTLSRLNGMVANTRQTTTWEAVCQLFLLLVCNYIEYFSNVKYSLEEFQSQYTRRLHNELSLLLKIIAKNSSLLIFTLIMLAFVKIMPAICQSLLIGKRAK